MSPTEAEARRTPDRWWNLAITGLVFAAALYLLSRTIADPDIWGHVLFGLDIIRDTSIPRTDPYSYLSGEWINHEWASEVVFGALFGLAGPLGLILFKVAVSLTIAGLAFRELRREGLDPLRAGLLLVLVILLLLPGLYTVRPQLFTYLSFLILLLVLRDAEGGARRSLWLLPPLFVVWVNFHGGVLAGVGALGIWTAAHLALAALGRRPADAPPPALLIGVLVACCVATLANPYGWELPAFLLETGTVPRPDILEWRPLAIVSQAGLAYLAAMLLGAIALARSGRPRRPAVLALLAVLAVLPLLAYRHLQLFGMAFAILGAPHLADALRRRRAAPRVTEGSERLRPWFTGLAAFAALIMLVGTIPNLGCIRIDPARAMGLPARAVGVLQASGVRGDMAVVFGWGEFAIWKLRPRVRVSMDGRRETVYPDSIYQEYLRFQNGVGDWDALLDRPATDLALVATDLPTYNLTTLKPGWAVAYEDSVAAVFAREGSSSAARVAAASPPAVPPDGAGMCFP